MLWKDLMEEVERFTQKAVSGSKVELYRGIRPKVIEKVIFVTEVSVELFMWQKAVRYMFRAVH